MAVFWCAVEGYRSKSKLYSRSFAGLPYVYYAAVSSGKTGVFAIIPIVSADWKERENFIRVEIDADAEYPNGDWGEYVCEQIEDFKIQLGEREKQSFRHIFIPSQTSFYYLWDCK